MAHEMAKVVTAVNDARKAGIMTLKLKVSPLKNVPEAVSFGASISISLAQPDLDNALFYPDVAGNLHRNNPQQARIPAEAYRKVE